MVNVTKIDLANAQVEVHSYKIVTHYPDGSICEFWPGHGDVEAQRQGARVTGYGDDVMAFGLAHDVIHHFVAERLLRSPVSRVVWAAAHQQLKAFAREDERRDWPDRMCDEEHFVNTTLAMVTGAQDLSDPVGHMDTLTDDIKGYIASAEFLLIQLDLLPRLTQGVGDSTAGDTGSTACNLGS